jgi:hypothetical protein
MLAKTFDGCPAMGPDFTKCAYLAQYENKDAPKCKVQDDPSGMMVDEVRFLCSMYLYSK